MVRAPADWRSVLRRAEILVRRHDIRSLELLLPALHWRDVTARNRAVVLLARWVRWRSRPYSQGWMTPRPPPSAGERPTHSGGLGIRGPSPVLSARWRILR